MSRVGDAIRELIADPAVIAEIAENGWVGVEPDMRKTAADWGMCSDENEAMEIADEWWSDWCEDDPANDPAPTLHARARVVHNAMVDDIDMTDWEPPDYGVSNADFYQPDAPQRVRRMSGLAGLYGRDAF